MKRNLGRFLSLAFLAATLSGPAMAGVRVYVNTRPPAPIVEVRPAPPRPGLVWVGGYHRWDGNAYVWVPGRWDPRPRRHARWSSGRWIHNRHGWYYVEGRWR
jgi:hypothetical protein